jgi:phage terminase Nu1 subunit (DNA packaging protein)
VRDKSRTEIASILDLTETTIKRWVAQGLPCDASTRTGLYDEAEVLAWMKTNKKTGKVGHPENELSDDLKAMRARKEAAIVRRLERENQIAEGKLIDRAQVESNQIAKCQHLRITLMAMGSTLSPQLEGLTPIERQQLIDQYAETLLKEFAK